MRCAIGFALSAALVTLGACGGSGTGNDNGTGPDASGPSQNQACEQGGTATTDEYMPFAVGNLWRYNVSKEIGSPVPKRQEITEEKTPAGETAPVLVQMTTKPTGSTESWFRREGTALVRLRQMDYDPTGALERTTLYMPYKLRFDESPERTVEGATWVETYTKIVQDPAGAELSRIEVMDRWTVVDTDAPCSTPWGQLACLQLHEEPAVGGLPGKDFWFARGYGKVREDGQSQLEELIGCALE